ncbi:MAG: galactokinase [Actinomycetota bacterium]|nr:galactokinase [Actinomycetota bacterium]
MSGQDSQFPPEAARRLPPVDRHRASSDRHRATIEWHRAPTGPAEDLVETGCVPEELVEGFVGRFGRDPEGIWSAPGRVNLIGEHVDYNDGVVLPFALTLRTYVALAPRRDGVLRGESTLPGATGWQYPLRDVAPGRVTGWAGYAAGVLWALRAEGLLPGGPGGTWPEAIAGGFDLMVHGQVPPGCGLSSSAALECAVAVAVDDLAGLGLSADDGGRARLAQACVRAENEVAGAPTGGMDQAAGLRCTPGAALLLDCRDSTASQLPFDPVSAGLEVLVMDTRTTHALIEGQYAERRLSCERAASALGVKSLRELEGSDPQALGGRVPGGPDGVTARRMRHVVSEMDRVGRLADLLRRGLLERAGPVLDASHASLRDDFGVSCPELDLACDSARAAGALGARLTGGGFGGSAIALVRAGDAVHVAQAVTEAFARSGWNRPAFLLGRPSQGAGRTG